MRVCPQCGTRASLSFAILPGEPTVVCEQCFIKTTGHHPLPAGNGLTMAAYRWGQYVKDPALVAGAPAPTGSPPQVTIRGVTVKAVTIHPLNARQVTVTRTPAPPGSRV
jgi:hypothetical protein